MTPVDLGRNTVPRVIQRIKIVLRLGIFHVAGHRISAVSDFMRISLRNPLAKPSGIPWAVARVYSVVVYCSSLITAPYPTTAAQDNGVRPILSFESASTTSRASGNLTTALFPLQQFNHCFMPSRCGPRQRRLSNLIFRIGLDVAARQQQLNYCFMPSRCGPR
jgi:hypothetical protein